MKSAQQHTDLFFRCLLILSGILFYSLIPLNTHAGEYEFSHLFQYETEYDSVTDVDNPEEKEADQSNHIFELVFKETAEKKESSADTHSPAVLKQGIKYNEVASVNCSLDSSILHNGPKLLPKEYSPDFETRTSLHFFSHLLSLTGDIAINAP